MHARTARTYVRVFCNLGLDTFLRPQPSIQDLNVTFSYLEKNQKWKNTIQMQSTFILYRHKINQLSHDENAEVHAGNLEAQAEEKEDFGGLLQQNENEEVITITSFLASQPASSKQLPNSFEFNLIGALDSHLLTSNSKEVNYYVNLTKFFVNYDLTEFSLLSKCFCYLILENHTVQYTVWKNENFGLTKKIFLQSNSLVMSLVKPLISRNFCQKCVRLNRSNFHTVQYYNDSILLSRKNS